jgi:RCC1 and BTB domain-containing protein
LGTGSTRKASLPLLVERLRKHRVVRVASYNEHTAALVEPYYDPSLGDTNAVNTIPVSAAFISQNRAMVNNEEFSDVTFLVENEPVYAHRVILAHRCDHFAAMFRSGMRESTERFIPIPNISKQVFLLLLEYLYTDSVKIDVEYAVELYIASDLYNLEQLRERCCMVVRRNLNFENAGPLLQMASDACCYELKQECMKYVVENFDVVSKSEGIKQVTHQILLEILSQR